MNTNVYKFYKQNTQIIAIKTKELYRCHMLH